MYINKENEIKVEPLIKWSGSKRSQAHDIFSALPYHIYVNYYEPFCGGASMMFYIMKNVSWLVSGTYVASDINPDLIATYNAVKNNPQSIINAYKNHYKKLVGLSIEDRKKYFYDIRQRLNEQHDPCDFFWIMRTATNGMPRYNKNGEFNNSFHVTRVGMSPERIEKIVLDYHKMMHAHNVEFVCCPYTDIVPNENDLVYCDPPYAGTKGMYYGGIDTDELFKYLGNLKCNWMLSFDGKAGDKDMTADVPKDLYDAHYYIESGNSSFRRVIGSDKHCIVNESLYIKFYHMKNEERLNFVKNLQERVNSYWMEFSKAYYETMESIKQKKDVESFVLLSEFDLSGIASCLREIAKDKYKFKTGQQAFNDERMKHCLEIIFKLCAANKDFASKIHEWGDLSQDLDDKLMKAADDYAQSQNENGETLEQRFIRMLGIDFATCRWYRTVMSFLIYCRDKLEEQEIVKNV